MLSNCCCNAAPETSLYRAGVVACSVGTARSSGSPQFHSAQSAKCVQGGGLCCDPVRSGNLASAFDSGLQSDTHDLAGSSSGHANPDLNSITKLSEDLLNTYNRSFQQLAIALSNSSFGHKELKCTYAFHTIGPDSCIFKSLADYAEFFHGFFATTSIFLKAFSDHLVDALCQSIGHRRTHQCISLRHSIPKHIPKLSTHSTVVRERQSHKPVYQHQNNNSDRHHLYIRGFHDGHHFLCQAPPGS